MYGGVVLHEGLMIRSRQVEKESFTNAFSSNPNTVNIKMFHNHVRHTLEDKALTSLWNFGRIYS